MELINNRYKIIKRLNKDKHVSIFKVEDLWDENKEMQLNILEETHISSELIDYFSSEFIRFINLKNKNLVSDYHFNRLTHVDNKKHNDVTYYFASEYVKRKANIIDYLDEMSFNEIIDVFVAICRAVNYLHIKGHAYENICMKNIIYEEESGLVKLESLALVRIQNQFNISGCSMIHILDPNHSRPGQNTGSKTDLHELGVLLLNLINKTTVTLYPERELDQMESNLMEKDSDKLRVIPIIRELLRKPKDIVYKNVSEVIEALNKQLQEEYSIVEEDIFASLNFHTKLINQEKPLELIDKSVGSLVKFETGKKLFLLHGDTGIGKTRLMEEIEFKYKLQGIDVYSAYTIHNSNANNRQFWLGMFRKLMRDCDVDVYEEYEKDLKSFFPELADNKTQVSDSMSVHKVKHQLMDRIGEFVQASVKNRQVIFLIDDVHMASNFTLRVIAMLTNLLKEENAILIFTYNLEEVSCKAYFHKFLRGLMGQRGVEQLQLEGLSEVEIGEVIKNVLSVSYVLPQLARQIHLLSDGNPAYTIEALKDLYSRDVIYINPETGHWNLNLPEAGKYESLAIPTSVEQILLNQVENLDESVKGILRKMSIYLAPKSVEFWEEVFQLKSGNAYSILLDLKERGILTITVDESIALYGFKNKILQRFLKKELSADKRRTYHEKAAKLIEEREEELLLDEMIHHFEQAGLRDKVKAYCLKNAREMKRLNDWGSMFLQLKKALAYETDEEMKINILMDIASNYLGRDNKDDAYLYYKKAEKLIASKAVTEQKIDIYLKITNLEIYRSEPEIADVYLEKVKQFLKQHPSVKGDLEYRRAIAQRLIFDGRMEEAIDVCLSVMDDAGKEYVEIKAKTSQLLAYTYTYGVNKVDTAIRLYEHAIVVFEERGLIRELIYSLNNLAVIYLERLQQLDIAFEKFTELNELSTEHNFISGHVLSLINIGAIYGGKGKIKLAYDTFIDALEKTKQAKGLKNRKPFIYTNIIRMGLNLHLYEEADYYMEKFKKDFATNKYPEYEKVQMHLAKSLYYFSLGLYDKADENDRKVLNSMLDESNALKAYSYVRTLMHNIRTKTPDAYETDIQKMFETIDVFRQPKFSVPVLLDFTLVLHEQNDIENVKRLNKKISKLMQKIDDPIARLSARYHYLRGVVVEDDTWEEQLLLSLHYAEDEVEFSARVMLQIAERYAKTKRLYLAANYYLEAGYVFKKLLEQVPDKHKISYIQAHQCAIAFRQLEVLQEIIIHKARLELLSSGAAERVHSLQEVKQMMLKFDIGVFTENRHFMNIIQKEYRRFRALEFDDIESVISNLSSDASENVKMLLSYLVTTTMTNRAYVVTEAINGELELLSSVYDEKIEINEQIFKRVKSSLSPVVLITDAEVSDLVVNRVKRSLYMPIFGNDYYLRLRENEGKISNRDFSHNIIGYLCLESDKVVNNLTMDIIHEEVSLLNLIALLIEKQQLQVAASVDKITGALTRKYLEDGIVEQFNKLAYTGEDFSIIMIDLDRFKRINDMFGHQVGDEVLRNLSKLLMERLGNKGSLGRYGGEEFIVILPNSRLVQAVKIAEELRILTSEARLLEDETQITISLGVVSTEQAKSLDDLIGKADQSLYIAKEAGRNKVIAWDKLYANRVQKRRAITEFTTGDEVQDSRNILALVELLELANKAISLDVKFTEFISRTMEAVEAQTGYIFHVKDGLVQEVWTKNTYQGNKGVALAYNEQLLESTIASKEASYVVQWGDLEAAVLNSDLPNWHSNLMVPIIYQNKLLGVIYLIASARVKEFEVKDLNIVNVLSNIAATILSDRQ